MNEQQIRHHLWKRAYFIIPALNEEESLPGVLIELKNLGIEPSHILVIDNGSIDGTAKVAAEQKVFVVREPNKGYGIACLTGISFLKLLNESPEFLVFIDGDGSDDLNDLFSLFQPFVMDARTDFVLGTRTQGGAEKGSLSFLQKFGNALSCFLLKVFYGVEFTDLGPFRVLRWNSFLALEQKDKTWGWNLEMQIKAVQKGFHIAEVPVRYERRKGGESKISGTLIGSLRAGAKILWIFFYLTFLASGRRSKESTIIRIPKTVRKIYGKQGSAKIL
ncbi:glycosyltransferase, group 2 family protein [Leptospira fainei serovar Hurstbridge str. BUT 6]|uniref:Glycosyltransferase, group 2 family protein n=1 Tax=Leptospira fainei serovar Hurstbridge str. BUT 6 TaxID=1193011 RepID=S3VID6_9LEPT|nr:glycosyltransferase family 2 protein [Leptospira fainei]EPG76240.1 glycosyltransferase, group 2 family protein [Leptospira fainei serovar Hurstbridge str. BUT 6]